MKNLKQVAMFAATLILTSCATTHDLLIGDVISFSEEANTNFLPSKEDSKWQEQTAPYMIHTDKVQYDNKEAMALKKQIKTAPQGVNTSIAYAQDLGLDRIKYIRKKYLKGDKMAKYYTIIVTDGLDNTSVEVARNHKQGRYKDLNAYHKKIAKKIRSVMGNSKEPNLYQVYPMLQIGEDLEKLHQDQLPQMSKEEFSKFCRDNFMQQYRGASKGWEVPEALAAYSFDELAEQFEEIFSIEGFEFYVPKGFNGKRIKMNLVDELGRKASFEGTIVKKSGTYYIKDIQLNDGLVAKTAKKKAVLELKATNSNDKKAIRAWFRIESLKLNGKSFKVDPNVVEQYYKEKLISGAEIWQYNSEYRKQAKPKVGTYFQFIFDTSESLKDEIKNEQDMLIKIFNIITKQLKEV